MKPPNFFIVGAPKCGTTALANYLSEHPNVFMSVVKEPHYFAEDFPRLRYVENEIDYLAIFHGAMDKHLQVGEASVFYLSSQIAMQKIKAFNKYSKLIVMLRNPLDMVYSFHSQVLYERDEHVSDFVKAWSLIDKRKAGHALPESCRDRRFLYYDEIGKFGKQMERLFTQFPRDQVFVIFYDDFSADTSCVYSAVLNFLELPKDGRTSFPVVNANKQNRSAIVGQLTQKTPAGFVQVAMAVKKVLGIETWGVLDFLRTVNRIDMPRAPLAANVKKQIANCYRDDVAKLSVLTGRDLSAWLS